MFVQLEVEHQSHRWFCGTVRVIDDSVGPHSSFSAVSLVLLGSPFWRIWILKNGRNRKPLYHVFDVTLLLPGTTWLEMRISYGCWPCSVGTAQFLWSERKVLVRQGFNFCGSLLQSLAANLTSMALLGTVAWENGEERGRPSLWRGSFRFLSWSLRQNLRAPGAHF